MWRVFKASLALYAVIGLALWALAGCAVKQPKIERDVCTCDMPWVPFLDPCCYGQTQETMR